MKNVLVTIILLFAAAPTTFSQEAKGTAETARSLEKQRQQPQLVPDKSDAHTPTIIHPWWVVANGGGSATGGGLVLTSSIGQSATQSMTGSAYSLEGGYIPTMRQLSGTTGSILQTFAAGWNLMSVPLIMGDYRRTVLYPTAISDAYKFDSTGYVSQDTLDNGTGYWLKFPPAQFIPLTGTALTNDTVDVRARWNIIGCVSYPILTSGVIPIAPVTIESHFYSYRADSGYQETNTLLPGGGYWVKVSQAGRLVIQSGSLLELAVASQQETYLKKFRLKVPARMKEVNTITIQDATGKTRSLYFFSNKGEVDLASYELPPLPPAGVIDVRYKSQRSAELYDVDRGGKQLFPIQITDALYPLTVSWSLSELGGKYALEILRPDGEQQLIRMLQGGTLRLEQPSRAFTLHMEGEAVVQIPKEFALAQNYPNPFNPSTTIKYELPVDSRVVLTVYNVIGQEVTTLVNGEQEAGYWSAKWDANNVASGVYLYRLQAGDFVASKKLLLLK